MYNRWYGGGEVWIKKYHLEDEKVVSEVYEGTTDEINFRDFSWKYIKEIKESGWVQDKKPAICTIIASEGMLEIANEILKKNRQGK